MERFDAAAEKAAAVRQTKGVLLGLLLALMVPMLLLAYPFAIAPMRNDWAADRLLRGLLAELPPGAEVVETAAWAGNSSGTGNHVELWAGALLRSDCQAAAAGTPAEKLREDPWLYSVPGTVDLEELFPTLAALDDWTGYVIRGTHGDAATQWDIRGH